VEGGCGYSCSFPNVELHQGAEFSLNVSSSQGETKVYHRLLKQEGREGSAPMNFSCIIYAVHFMNCSWEPGPAAPADVHYRLYYWTSWDKDESECPQYTLNRAGTAVGCHLAQFASTDTYFFLLNGTSAETHIPFVDFAPFRGVMMEKYDPPGNLSSHENGSYHVIEWDNPKRRYELSTHILLYEICIRREGVSNAAESVFQRGEKRNQYPLPRSAVRADTTVRIRVRHAYGHYWSEWSSPLALGGCPVLAKNPAMSPVPGSPALGRTLGMPESEPGGHSLTLILPVLGTSCLCVTVILFLCQRLAVRQKLFPPIPGVNRAVVGSLESGPEGTWTENMAPPVSQEHEYMVLEQIQLSPRQGQDRTDDYEILQTKTPTPACL
ncbi:granulocyte-macrophage colony-stimulating factor receptor subunit alpha, partial [Sorex fumeus]|uniref:granulocyte-macrophage colony-stimulating factor receptor subunit alpha n=1 Tax=Sorex fumeus TaxID=62283 RepID=UPI0024AE0126